MTSDQRPGSAETSAGTVPRIAIIGGGIGGVTCAYLLAPIALSTCSRRFQSRAGTPIPKSLKTPMATTPSMIRLQGVMDLLGQTGICEARSNQEGM